LLREGKGIREVARLVKAAPSSVKRWSDAVAAGGRAALAAKPHPGRTPRLTPPQKRQLVKRLKQGALKAGFGTALWTCSRVAQLIEKEFGVRYHRDHVWRLLVGLGWSCQKPERQARERDERAIQQWRQEQWPRLKKRRSPASKPGISR
jgi:transposase